MRSDLDHLPPAKQRELERVVQTLFEEFALVNADATGRRKAQRILKIILFGSYARDDWVDATLDANQYKSDYDLLVIVSSKQMTDRVAYWANAEERLIREYVIEKTLKTPVNFIVHSLQQVNDGLAHGRVFFMELAKDGIALYEADDRELAQPQPKTPRQALKTAKDYYAEWFPSAMKRFEIAKFSIQKGYLKDAAFDLHQATERLYNCVLLTLTCYSPHNHNIAFLRSQADRLDRRLVYIWLSDTHAERAMFHKLREAYVKARYSKHYQITEDELAWLSARVEELGQVVHAVCTDHIAKLEAAAARS